jgi:phosphonate transport system substrate-binding protein
LTFDLRLALQLIQHHLAYTNEKFSMEKGFLSGLILAVLLTLTSCSSEPSSNFSSPTDKPKVQPLVTGAIPDQDLEKLQRLYSKLADYLEKELGVPVEYKPVTDYTATVTAFRVGDLDFVWFGGLTGVQARLQVPGAEAIAQRDIDANFHSVFIANKKSDIKPFKEIKDLQSLKGHSLTFGSQSSTSGRLMPQYFLEQAGLTLENFKGQVGFSKSHDATIELVQGGAYEAGVLNAQVWQSRVKEGKIDPTKVEVIWETPAYYDYHWVVNGPKVREKYGENFVLKLQNALLKLSPAVPEQKEILDLFGAAKFIPTNNGNYAQIEEIGKKIGKIK